MLAVQACEPGVLPTRRLRLRRQPRRTPKAFSSSATSCAPRRPPDGRCTSVTSQLLRAADGGFDERRFGFGGLMDLLRACQRDGLMRLERDRRAGSVCSRALRCSRARDARVSRHRRFRNPMSPSTRPPRRRISRRLKRLFRPICSRGRVLDQSGPQPNRHRPPNCWVGRKTRRPRTRQEPRSPGGTRKGTRRRRPQRRERPAAGVPRDRKKAHADADNIGNS